MPFPQSPRVIYDINPLAEVICQFKFPAILRIASADVAPYQERIREQYPLYKLEERVFDAPGMPKEMVSLMEQMVPRLPGTRTHRFLTKDSKRFISLSHEFLAVSESDYKQWEKFLPEIKRAEQALREVYKPAFYSRLGLRYKDVISPSSLGLAGRQWSELISTHTAAELGDQSIAQEIKQIRTQCVKDLPEISGGRVTLNHGLIKDNGSGETKYLIDADFAIDNMEGSDAAFNVLDKFHIMAGQLFRWAISETLHNAMGPRPIG
jgi:uncharacterized protein (TIGR04255 family)